MIKISISVVFAGCHWNNIAFDSDKIPVQSRQIMDTNSQIDNTKEGFQDDSLKFPFKLKPEGLQSKAYQSSAFQTIYLTIIAIPELIHLATQGKKPGLIGEPQRMSLDGQSVMS